MPKPEVFGNKLYKPLDSVHDLTRGERSYLKEHGISEREFDKMDAVSQHEWKGECQEVAYESMRGYKYKK
jgi:hypothetical protein